MSRDYLVKHNAVSRIADNPKIANIVDRVIVLERYIQESKGNSKSSECDTELAEYSDIYDQISNYVIP